MSSRQERVNVGSGQEGVNGENLRLRGSPWLSEILSRMNQAPRTRDRSEEEEERFSRSPRDMSGGALDPNACRLEWSHDDCAVVGTPSAATLTVSLYHNSMFRAETFRSREKFSGNIFVMATVFLCEFLGTNNPSTYFWEPKLQKVFFPSKA